MNRKQLIRENLWEYRGLVNYIGMAEEYLEEVNPDQEIDNIYLDSDKYISELRKDIHNSKMVVKCIDFVMEELSDLQQEVLELFYFEGLDSEEVSDKLLLSEERCIEVREEAIEEVEKILY